MSTPVKVEDQATLDAAKAAADAAAAETAAAVRRIRGVVTALDAAIAEVKSASAIPDNSEPNLYEDAAAAANAVREDYQYWSGKLSDFSVQMCYSVLAANWMVFGSISGIEKSVWAHWSVAFVIGTIAMTLLGAWLLTNKLSKRIDYAEKDYARWRKDFDETREGTHAFPYTKTINHAAEGVRAVKTWFPLIAGALFVIGVIMKP